MEGGSEEENELINLQISLLDPTSFICGQCQKVVAKDKHEYITHMCAFHSCLHPLNSHIFTFTPTPIEIDN